MALSSFIWVQDCHSWVSSTCRKYSDIKLDQKPLSFNEDWNERNVRRVVVSVGSGRRKKIGFHLGVNDVAACPPLACVDVRVNGDEKYSKNVPFPKTKFEIPQWPILAVSIPLRSHPYRKSIDNYFDY